MKTSKLSFILITYLTLPLLAKDVAKTKSTDVFKEALINAYKTNPDFAAAQANYQAQSEAEPQAFAAFAPTVQAQGGYSKQSSFVQYTDAEKATNPMFKDIIAGDTFQNNLSWSVNAKLNLFQGLAGIANLSKAQYSVLSSAASLRFSESKLLTDAIAAYMDCITKQKSLESYIASEQSLSNLHEAAKTKFQVGEITKSELLQALASYQDAKAARIKGEGDLETSRTSYQKTIGLAPGSLKIPSLPKERLPKTLEEAIELTLKSNPAIIKAQFDEKAANEGWTITFSEFLPSVDATTSFNSNRYDPIMRTEGPQGSLSYGVQATWNIFTGLSSASKLRATAQNIEQAKSQLESARRSGIELATKSWRDLISVKDEIKARKATIEAAALALEGFRQGARLGAYSMLQVLDTESKYVQAKVNLAIALQKEVQSTFGLLSAIGVLSAQELNLIEKEKQEVQNN